MRKEVRSEDLLEKCVALVLFVGEDALDNHGSEILEILRNDENATVLLIIFLILGIYKMLSYAEEHVKKERSEQSK